MPDSFDNESFLKELLNDFKIEALEHYDSIVKGLIDLENTGTPEKKQEIIERIFRNTHSLKGAARAVNLSEIERLCSTLETIFGHLKKGEIAVTSQLLDSMHKSVDVLKVLIDNLNDTGKNIQVSANSTIKNLEYLLKLSLQQTKDQKQEQEATIEKERILKEESEISENTSSEKEAERHDLYSVRIPTGHLHQILAESEDFIAVKTTLDYYRKNLENIYVKYKDDDLYKLIKDLIAFQTVSSRMIDDLIINIRETLLSNFSTLLKVIPKMVRDLSKEYSKEITLNIRGEETEIDRRILEELKDPLIHIIRNCIDHGIETPQERVDIGKEIKGKIDIKIEKLIDRKVRITITDDGAGINFANVIQSAEKNGLLIGSDPKTLSKEEIISLIFKSGVSSRKFVTDISGRGLGMSIVAEKIADLGGSIEVSTEQGKWTKFVLVLPQTISTFRGILIESENVNLMVPSLYVDKAVRVTKDNIGNIGDKSVIKCNNGETLGVVRLSRILGISGNVVKKDQDEFIRLLILTNNNKRVAFIVDNIWGEYEGIVKDMGPQLQYIRNIAGVTIIENGKVIPVLNVSELIDSSSEGTESYEPTQNLKNQSEKESKEKKILIVEDSITVRTMLKHFVENAGYNVTTAVDGLDGFNKFSSEEYDMIISDIEMPRMNGFELTKRVRDAKNHSDIPVILVTALETPTDMKMGMDAGADAYIVKSSFEKSNLLQTIQRFI